MASVAPSARPPPQVLARGVRYSPRRRRAADTDRNTYPTRSPVSFDSESEEMAKPVKARREDRDYEDLVRLYLEDVGRHNLLTKDDESPARAGDRDRHRRHGEARDREEAHAHAAALAPARDPPGRRGAPPVRELEPAARRLDREEVPELGSARCSTSCRRATSASSTRSTSSTGARASSSRRTRRGGSARPSSAASPTRRASSGCPYTPATCSPRCSSSRASLEGSLGRTPTLAELAARSRAAAREGRRGAALRGRHRLARRARP